MHIWRSVGTTSIVTINIRTNKPTKLVFRIYTRPSILVPTDLFSLIGDPHAYAAQCIDLVIIKVLKRATEDDCAW